LRTYRGHIITISLPTLQIRAGPLYGTSQWQAFDLENSLSVGQRISASFAGEELIGLITRVSQVERNYVLYEVLRDGTDEVTILSVPHRWANVPVLWIPLKYLSPCFPDTHSEYPMFGNMQHHYSPTAPRIVVLWRKLRHGLGCGL
jgi:hypothetical protein